MLFNTIVKVWSRLKIAYFNSSRLLPEWSLCNLVCQLQALKGVGQLIAITLVAELGDFSRFSNPKQLMAFLGLVPSEYSSGNSIAFTPEE